MVSTHDLIFNNPAPVVPADDPEIETIETHYDKPSEVPYIYRASQDCDPEEQL